jgi:hypothetical protein
MTRLANFLILFAVLAMMVVGCSNQPNPVEPQATADPTYAARPTLPEGATLDAAYLHVYTLEISGQTVNVHRISADWDEMTVTWNNFGGFDPSIIGSFVSDGVEWQTIDVTALVGDWMDGTYPNYGFLLDEPVVSSQPTRYPSREAAANQPFLELCYTINSVSTCDTLMAVADDYIYQNHPDDNYGALARLYTGSPDENLEKQALIKFEVDIELAAIGDYVWHDYDMDGIQDEGEPGIAGITVTLYDCQDNALTSMMTDGNGYYMFTDLVPGDYHVGFELPPAWSFSPQDQGADDAVDSDADPVTGMTVCTTLDAGEVDPTWDAGMYLPIGEGCTLTIGYWKTHAGFGPQDDDVTPLLPVWLGDAGGTKSLEVTDAAMAVAILEMKTYGRNNNGITKLYAQLLGAKLSILTGAFDAAVAGVIADADAFLADYDWTDWRGLTHMEKEMVNGWQETLDDYNNGLIGPGHCDYVDPFAN